MRRLGLGLLLAVCALAGALAAVLMAGDVAAAVAPPGTDTTGTTATTTLPTTTVPSVLADGVSVGGVDVSGLAPDAAVSIIRTAFEARLVLNAAGKTLQPSPADLGAIAYVQNAVARARTAPPGTVVPLTVRVDGRKVRAYVAKVAQRLDRACAGCRYPINLGQHDRVRCPTASAVVRASYSSQRSLRSTE